MLFLISDKDVIGFASTFSYSLPDFGKWLLSVSFDVESEAVFLYSTSNNLNSSHALTNAVGQYINVSLYKAIDKIKIFQGDLLAFDGETLTIDYLDKTRHKTVEIPYQTVAKARLAVKL